MPDARIGLLPLYLALYDEVWPERRKDIQRHCDQIAGAVARTGVEADVAPICVREPEIRAALRRFDASEIDLLVTLHLAYSPSMESAGALVEWGGPILLLDTSPDYDFGPGQDAGRIRFNHGIHGVQDLANRLLRADREFVIEAGHYGESDVLERVRRWAEAARLVRRFRASRIGRIGGSFPGMGDFAVSDEDLQRTFGISVMDWTGDAYEPREEDIAEEVANDRERFELPAPFDEDEYRRAIRSDLVLRAWAREHCLSAVAMSFLEIGSFPGFFQIPFLEVSKGMERGIGYAGESDVLTAALVGALVSRFPRTTFTEMFCSDWKSDRVFLSHMGEWNLSIASDRPKLDRRELPFGEPSVCYAPVGRYRAGDAVLVNLAPLGEGRFRLILCPGEVWEPNGEDMFPLAVHGWFCVRKPVARFLEAYSRLGGTHHLALAYTEELELLERFGRLLGLDVHTI